MSALLRKVVAKTSAVAFEKFPTGDDLRNVELRSFAVDRGSDNQGGCKLKRLVELPSFNETFLLLSLFSSTESGDRR